MESKDNSAGSVNVKKGILKNSGSTEGIVTNWGNWNLGGKNKEAKKMDNFKAMKEKMSPSS